MINSNYLFVVEKYERSNKTVLIDHYESNGYSSFRENLDFVNISEKHPSMILIKNYEGKRLTEGTVYMIDKRQFDLAISNVIQLVEDSFVVGFEFLSTESINLFNRTISRWNILMELLGGLWSSGSDGYSLPKNMNQLVVRNVGQGSWNEIKNSKKVELVYDFGTSYIQKKTQVQNYIDKKIDHYKKDCPVLIISHWDIDHYHFLKVIDDETIKSFSKIIVKEFTPSLTSRYIMGRLTTLNGKNIITLRSQKRPKQKGSPVPLNLLNNPRSSLLLFNSDYDRNRNKNGIGLLIQKRGVTIILPGDLYYDQIELMTNYIHSPTKHHLLVPHHGGNAGTYKYNLPKKSTYSNAVISVGKNHYGHPFPNILNSLRKSGFIVSRTQIKGDFVVSF